MLNEPSKKHKDCGNCHVSVSDIGMETASSSTVLVHNGSRYYNSGIVVLNCTSRYYRYKPVQSDTSPVPYLYHRVYWKVKSIYETHTASPAPVKRTYILVGWCYLSDKNVCQKMDRTKATVIFLFSFCLYIL